MRDYPIIDADTHVNVPMADLVERVPDKFKIELPERIPSLLLVNAVGISPVEWKLMGDEDDERRYRAGAWDPAERVKDMDIDYVDVHVLYGGGAAPGDDRDSVLAYTRAYNDWLSDFCSYAPDRLFGPAQVPHTGVDDAMAEMKRVKDMPGICGGVLNSWPNGSHKFPHHADDDPFWSLMEELDMPVVVHVGIGSEGEGDTNALDILARPGIGFPYINKERLAIGFLDVASHMIVGGVLDRHPDLRFGCIESGIGWVPFFLEQTEDNWSRHRFWSDTLLSMRPSEFWTRQCFATFQIDHWGVASRAAVGINTVMWSSDYPHSGADWPESQRVIDEHLKDVPPDEQRLILSDNAARLYGLDINKLGRAQPPVGAGVRLS